MENGGRDLASKEQHSPRSHPIPYPLFSLLSSYSPLCFSPYTRFRSFFAVRSIIDILFAIDFALEHQGWLPL
ncbi:hypothetical protein Ahy_B06g079957 isoform B [Arachis hypogaea]|uniref:Uncharacterized protein n=1 Tax=Arachis hypogaea TaxID=3818 RepID=A0A444YGU4_ARAHY|nr:hypothetical protein Ahy_B06g079957 isoform B [Arachis hypogaea]